MKTRIEVTSSADWQFFVAVVAAVVHTVALFVEVDTVSVSASELPTGTS